MKRRLTRSCCEKCFAFLLVFGGAPFAGAQSTADVQEILSRLDRLEKENQAMSQEIHALRQELVVQRSADSGAVASAVAAPNPSGGAQAGNNEPGASAAQPIQEQLAVQRNRIDEMAQDKVEASQKFSLRITGMALFNAYLNGRNNNDVENPTIASEAPADATGGGTLRQSTLGLLFSGPQTVFGSKVSGSLYMDFFGGSTASLDHLVRLRTAAINLEWANTTLTVGQDKPLISPRDPDSLAQVGVSPLTGAGNLWLWQPQIRLEQRIGSGPDSGLRLQAAGIQTSQLNVATDPNAYATSPSGGPVQDSNPGAETRVEFWQRWSETGRLEIAGGFHVNENHVERYSLPADIYSLDWFFRPVNRVEFSGMFYHGRNVAVLGALRQGYTVLSGNWLSVPSNGGWAQLRFPLTERLAVDIYGGQEDDRNSDLVYGDIAKNQGYFGNVMYRFAPNVIVSLEGGQVRTNYIRLGNRLNDHYDLGVAYLF